MDRFVLIREPGETTALLVDREALAVARVAAGADPSNAVAESDLIEIPRPRDVSGRMYYHQALTPHFAA
jgi:hypothetical protein